MNEMRSAPEAEEVFDPIHHHRLGRGGPAVRAIKVFCFFAFITCPENDSFTSDLAAVLPNTPTDLSSGLIFAGIVALLPNPRRISCDLGHDPLVLLAVAAVQFVDLPVLACVGD